jgi:branched-chain amino acid transport system permease protein
MKVSTRSGLRNGLLMGLINALVVLLGLTGLAGSLLSSWFGFSTSRVGAWLLLLAVAFVGGSRTARAAKSSSWRQAALVGLWTGLVQGVLMALVVGLLAALIDAEVDVRKWLVQLSPEAVDLVTWGLGPLGAALVMLVLLVLSSTAGALVFLASQKYAWKEARTKWWQQRREQIAHAPAVERFLQYRYSRQVTYGVVLLVLLGAPVILGRYWNYTLGTVGIYVMLGLGLNIVVGMTGLLNLGYVAFFAIGAYTVAILTSPQYNIGWSFWVAVPIGTFLAAITGVLLSIPVLRMRGDYLAIVTLGFGEIIRILAKSDALTDFTGGPRGIRSVGGPALFGLKLNSEFWFMYIIMLGIALLVYLTWRLQSSRVGRAWMAMREDEDVAQAVGIYTLKYKVLAFAIGAACAGLGGVIFASRNKFTGPEDFAMLVSINVLCLVIIGGMGSIPGVVVGALVLKGLPEILRQLDDYRMLAFGALLVVMMILRPEGLWPSMRQRAELGRDEEQPEAGAVLEQA